MAITTTTRKRLEIAGYSKVNEAEFAQVGPWIRFAYAGCTSLVAIGTAFAMPTLLWTMVLIAAISAASPYHPFDLLYNHGVRRLTGTVPIPKQGAPRRFSCGAGALWLVFTALAFQFGAAPVGYILGGSLVAIALLVSTTYICISSLIYRFVFRKPVNSIIGSTASAS